ncbi:MAG: hypothetical protein FP827_07100 [Candidatus Omnitrophica bacterium]|nr:hypothetical protein [Candidatus Omnitrophota bacterium]
MATEPSPLLYSMKNKAVILFSGGLDSSLAAKLTEDIFDLSGVVFSTPFSRAKKEVFALAEKMSLPLKHIFLGEEYFEIILKPKFGMGKGMNPCLDCHIMMLKKAKLYAIELGAEFLITGEVLAQRMMSQKIGDLFKAEKETALEGRIIRPLCGALLPPTEAEKKGIIKRDEMFSVSGKSRKTQFELAEKYALSGFATPAGGCVLTDKIFSKRIKDAVIHGELDLLRSRHLMTGRHFRLEKGSKLVIARKASEDKFLSDNAVGLIRILPSGAPGPGALLSDMRDIDLALSIIARYSGKTHEFIIRTAGEADIVRKAEAADEETVRKYLV